MACTRRDPGRLALLLAAIAALPAVVGGGAAVAPSAARRAAPAHPPAAAPLGFEREMLAGAVARAAAQVVMYPADVMKTLAQVAPHPASSPPCPCAPHHPGRARPKHMRRRGADARGCRSGRWGHASC